MYKLSERLSHLNPFSTKNFGFLDIWLKKYYSEKDSKVMSNKYNQIIGFYFILMTIRMTIALIYRSDNILRERMSVYLGSWSVLLGGPPHYFELISLLWDIQCVGSYFTILYRPRNQFLWIELFGAINGSIYPKTIGIEFSLLERLVIMVLFSRC